MLRLEITSDHDIQNDRELVQACKDLYLDLSVEMEDGAEVHPDVPTGIASERGVLEIFHRLLMTGMSLGVFGGAFNLLKLWLDGRPTCEVTLTYPDGFQLKVSKISLDEAKRLHAEHAEAVRAAQAQAQAAAAPPPAAPPPAAPPSRK
jgi:hypothetical protein